MMNIVQLISPLIVMVALGFLAAKCQWLDRTAIQSISKLTFNLCIPAFLFQQMANASFSKPLDFSFFAAFYLPVLLCFAVAWLISYVSFNNKTQASSHAPVYALGASYSNTVIIGLPVLLALQGQSAVVPIFLIVTFHSAILFTLTSILAAKQQQFAWRSIINNTVNNPLLISIALGALVNFSALPIASWIMASLTLVSSPAIALALFVLGASLTFYNLRQAKRFVAIATLLKLLLLPALVWFSAQHILHLPLATVQILVLLSACPTGVNAYLIAINLKAQQQTVASTVLLSTLLSVLTIPFWLFLLT
jgi:malonate transporter and related proteins